MSTGSRLFPSAVGNFISIHTCWYFSYLNFMRRFIRMLYTIYRNIFVITKKIHVQKMFFRNDENNFLFTDETIKQNYRLNEFVSSLLKFKVFTFQVFPGNNKHFSNKCPIEVNVVVCDLKFVSSGKAYISRYIAQ